MKNDANRKSRKCIRIIGCILIFAISPLLMGQSGCGVATPPLLIVRGQISQPGGEDIPDGFFTIWAEDITTGETDFSEIYSNEYELGFELSEEGSVIKFAVKDRFGKQYGGAQRTVTAEDLDVGQMTVGIILEQPIEVLHLHITLLQPDGTTVSSSALRANVKCPRAGVTQEITLSSDGYKTSLLLPDVGDEVEIVIKDANNRELAKEVHSITAEERATREARLSVKLLEGFIEKLDISGEVFGIDGKKIASGGLWMMIRNLGTGEQRSTEITDGNYSLYFINPTVGNEIEFQVAPAFETIFDIEGERAYAQTQRVLNKHDLENGLKLNVTLHHRFTLAIAISGLVSSADGVIYEGLEVALENWTRFKGDGVAALLAGETDSAFLAPAKSPSAYRDFTDESGQYEAYALFCLPDDVIQVTVIDPESNAICGSAEHRLTLDELDVGQAVVNVRITPPPAKMQITGAIYQSDGVTPINADALDAKIEVENLTAKLTISENVSAAKYKLGVFAKPEDELWVKVKNKYSNTVYGQTKYRVTRSDIIAKATKIDVILDELSTVVLTVDGIVYKSDGVTLAQDGLKVIVENTTRSKKSITHTEQGHYQVVFLDFMGKAAVLGDVIKIKVVNDREEELEEVVHTLTVKDVEDSRIQIDVRLK